MPELKVAWKARKDNSLIGKDIPRIDGVDKASGKAKYSADINTEGTLFARLLTFKGGAAVVKSLDTADAEKTPGVRAVHVFNEVGKEVRWDGTIVAAVAADTPEQAEDGVRAITVTYEAKPHWVDEEDLVGATEAKRTKSLGDNQKGEVAAALKAAKYVHTGYYGIATISHMCLEPHGSHCEWDGADKLHVHLSTQNVSGTGGQFAGGLGLDASNVRITCNYIGGGFGSKFKADQWGLACAELARKSGRPVRLMLDRATELKIGGTRPSGFIKVTIAADAEGNITAWDSHHWGTSGISGSTIRLNLMPYCFDNIPNVNRKATGISTNCGPNAAWRAPPHPQACAITDTAIDDLAGVMGMDSYDIFMKNLDKTKKADIYAAEMKIGAKLIDWKAKWHAHGKGGQGAVKRGLGMALHTWGGGAGGTKCTLKVHPDGSVETFLGSQDLGTGTRTVIAITLAETFGLGVEDVQVHLGNNSYPKANPSGGSITVGGVSGPMRRAGLTALGQIYDLVAAKYKVDAATLTAVGGRILSAGKTVCTWKQACGLLGPMPLEVQGQGPVADGLTSKGVGGVQMADVSVDTETGLVRINQLVAVQDCGMIIDELTARSQVYGGLIMGIAYALSEERIMDNRTGRFINADLENYKLPRIGDIGELLVHMYQPDSEYERGVVGLGEPPVISTGAAISNAVANATGVRVPVQPLTPRRVLEALKGDQA
ncbi:MAG: xanthine dehydrogenase family protein molybdopterin-binding subunit [Planctomycetaceae bacterium]